jgi:predicted RNA-binding Zn ribbon-like protein
MLTGTCAEVNEVKATINVESNYDEESRERKKKLPKHEPITTGAATLDRNASVDTFLTQLAVYATCRLCYSQRDNCWLLTQLARGQGHGLNRKECLEMSAFKLLLLELSRRNLTTVDQVRQLSRDQWGDVMRASSLSASLARSAFHLLLDPAAERTCIVLDD